MSSNLPTVPSKPGAVSVPDWMGDEFNAQDANKALTGFIRPPRMKIVQGTAKPPISEKYNPGDVCFVPTMSDVVARGKVFLFTPLFFFPEWMTFNPLGAEETIRERTFDPQHPIAVKSRRKETRKEVCPEDASKKIVHNSFMNFICMLMGDHEYAGTMFVMSFKGGEYATGSNLASSIKMRGKPMYVQVFQAKSSQRTRGENTWYGLDISPPTDPNVSPWVPSKETALLFKKEHESLAESHEKNLIVVDADMDDEPAQNEDFN